MSSASVLVFDYGVGNTGSILNMLKKIGAPAIRSSSIADIRAADRIILPGVGAFDAAKEKLEESGCVTELERRVLGDRIPLLGICLGMQLLTTGSEEGRRPGLGWIDAEVVRFRPAQTTQPLRVPHMGWNHACPAAQHNLFSGLERDARFYFAHSYHAVCRPENVLCTTEYGYQFASGLMQDNICGVQFHPERSHKYGFMLLRNFLQI
jgi:glutamine amidotransferase